MRRKHRVGVQGLCVKSSARLPPARALGHSPWYDSLRSLLDSLLKLAESRSILSALMKAGVRKPPMQQRWHAHSEGADGTWEPLRDHLVECCEQCRRVCFAL